MYTTLRTVSRALAVLLALGAVVLLAVPAASAHRNPPLRLSESYSLDIYDSYLSQVCGLEVFALVDGKEERTVFPGADSASPAREIANYDAKITWFVRASGKSYSDRLRSTLVIAYPEGIELWKPARVTVLGRHGGTFPIGGGPAGTGILVYDATVYAEDQGFPYWFVNGDPVHKLGTFDFTAKRICAALT